MTDSPAPRPAGTYRLGTYGEIKGGEWFMAANSDGWLYAVLICGTEKTAANPHVKIQFSESSEERAASISDWFPAHATAGIIRPE